MNLPSGNLTWQWNITIFNRKYIFKGSIFHCYVRLPECMSICKGRLPLIAIPDYVAKVSYFSNVVSTYQICTSVKAVKSKTSSVVNEKGDVLVAIVWFP